MFGVVVVGFVIEEIDFLVLGEDVDVWFVEYWVVWIGLFGVY